MTIAFSIGQVLKGRNASYELSSLSSLRLSIRQKSYHPPEYPRVALNPQSCMLKLCTYPLEQFRFIFRLLF